MSRRMSPLSILAIVLAGAGVLVAAYLTWVHYDAGALVCTVGDCHTVQESQFATIGPAPIALFGMAMFATVLVCQFVALQKQALAFPAHAIAFAAALGGAVYSAYLTWLEVAVIHAICQWCVVSAVLTIALAIVEGVVVWRLLGRSRPVVETTAVRDASNLAETPAKGGDGSGRRSAAGKVST